MERLAGKLLKVAPIPSQRSESGEHRAGWLSMLFFAWTAYLVRVCNQRQLQLEDIDELNPSRRVEVRVNRFISALESCRARGSKRPLQRAIFVCFHARILLAFGLLTLALGLLFAHVFSLKYFGRYLHQCYTSHHRGDGPVDVSCAFAKGVGFIAANVAAWVVAAIIRLHQSNVLKGVAAELRAILKSCILRKSAVMGPAVEGDEDVAYTTGKVLSIVSTDVERIHDVLRVLDDIYAVLPLLPLSIGLSWYFLGWQGLLPVCMLCVSIPLTTLLTGPVSRQRRIMNALMDERITLIHDTLQGVRLMKYFAWESSFQRKIDAVRKKEVARHQILYIFVLLRVFMGTMSNRPFIILAIALWFHSNSFDNSFEVVVFLYNFTVVIRQLIRLGPALTQAINASQSWERVESYLSAKEELVDAISRDPTMSAAVDLNAAKFSHRQCSRLLESREPGEADEKGKASADGLPTSFVLGPITLRIPRGEFVAVVGAVASGKTSLASALIGAMVHLEGEVRLASDVSYNAQSPWIRSASVRENILFGQAHDAEKYARILHVCCLNPDLAQFPFGDATQVGERGITLSGGQAARVQLARTLYQDREIILLDDPLSAVDAHTGAHIFHRALLEHLANKTRILITHQLQVLAKCDRIVWIQQGQIRAVGSLEQLRTEHPDFVKYLGLTKQVEVVEESAEDAVEVAAPAVAGLERVSSQEIALMHAEERHEDRIRWRSIYIRFTRLGGSWFKIACIISIVVFSQIVNTFYFVNFAWWSAQTWVSDNLDNALIGLSWTFGHWISWQSGFYLIHRHFLLASWALSNRALDRVLRAPTSFFDTTPLGRVINRFTLDVNMTDADLPDAMWWFVEAVFAMLALCGVCISYVPSFTGVFVAWVLCSAAIALVYRAVSRELKRLEALRDSMIIARSSEFLSGVDTIKSCNRTAELIRDFDDTLDEYNSIHIMSIAAHSWMLLCQQILSGLLCLLFGLLLVSARFRISPGIVLYLAGSSFDYTFYSQQMVDLLSNIQRGFVAVERLFDYADSLPDEGPRHLEGFNTDKTWPSGGDLTFSNVCLRYKSDDPLALTEFTLHVPAGQRLGIVGRTGAGKSSILAALLRTTPLDSGRIVLDGRDISEMGIHDLRSAISVIPQNPTLFVGTVRSNLDPRDEHLDDVLHSALRAASLLDSSDPHRAALTLASPVATDGSNFSHGDRQLMALARALVRRSRIIVSDEATSNVDVSTDLKIQEAMRGGFEGSTIVSIAHRIRTVLKYDAIVVVDEGACVETGSPRDLFRLERSRFRALCDRERITWEEVRGVDDERDSVEKG